MIAYEINESNRQSINLQTANNCPPIVTGEKKYFITGGADGDCLVIDKEGFDAYFTIIKTVNEDRGIFIINAAEILEHENVRLS